METLDQLRNQRDLLAEALGKLLQAYGIVRPDIAMTGPELLMAAEEATAWQSSQTLQPDVAP